MGGISPLRIFDGLFTYAREWAINGGIFEFLYSLFYAFKLDIGFSVDLVTKMVVAVTYIVILFFIFRKDIVDEKMFLYRVFWSIAFLFLLSPVGDPWYLCWVIPFLCFFPYVSFIILSWLIIFSYVAFTKDIGFVYLGNLKLNVLTLIQYVPFFILLFLEVLCLKRKRFVY